ncbi:MAG: calcineurin-like phosphoesterase C-terminal domain-containing protein [Bacteroidales bacterium]|nr:calcineurin-like phosphoesterase C-terminal domain-containing protein [Bacteroidales bacterium]
MKIRFFTLSALIVAAASCSTELVPETEGEFTVISVNLAETKTTLGPSAEGKRKVYWTDGDRMSLNGTASNPLSGVAPEAESADFVFPGVISAPYNLLYPASFYKNASTVTLPSSQAFAAGTVATNTAPLSGYAADAGDPVSLGHLCSIVQLNIKKDPSVAVGTIEKVSFKGNADEQVCGDFTIDYAAHTLTGASSAQADKAVFVSPSQALSESTALEVYLVVPAGTYASGFTVEIEDNAHRTMSKVKSGSVILTAGKLAKTPVFTYVPGSMSTELELEDVTEEVLTVDAYNVTGRVVDNSGNPLKDVVVSDGLQCVRTMFDGTFYMQSNTSKVKFVYVSSPSGYVPVVEGGIPKFYKALSSVSPAGGVYDFGNYVMTPVANPDRFTLLISADPQPRKNNFTLDKVAYKSLDVCQDLYQELHDVASGISDRKVYGICLGDIVHEDMSLYANYVSALGTLSYPTYNIIGNHDNDYDVSSDDEAGAVYESYFGPRNYSFNIGGIHFVMLDNLIQGGYNNDKTYDKYDQGLTDDIWTWLQADMAFVPTTTKIMVCAHSPMFKYQSGSERTNTAYHGGTTSNKNGGAYGYGDLFDKYGEVHAWAGHTHSGFNFVYSNTHRHKNIQVHTLARSTGELWTNEYLANGTPRGFTVVEVDNGTITWKFHPLTRQRGAFQGVNTGYCSAGAPAYTWRDWSYNGSGVAVMNEGGSLTEEYQMHAYPRGAYGDNYVYVNVFLWDEKWQKPVWTPDGGSPVEMTRIYSPGTSHIDDTEKIYDKADTEFRTWYKTNANKSGGSLAALDGYYTVAPDEDGKITTLFRAPATASPNSGTISVTDRFGNVYTRTVSW